MLNVQSISKLYGDQLVVDQVSFEVKKGETLVLLGTSGCGKTTTLKMINGLVEKSKGQVFINDKLTDEEDIYQLRRRIGYVIQETGLFPHYTISQNISLVPGLLGWDKQRIEQRTSELLELIGLNPGLTSSYPHELSGGQRQRVGLARALAADPQVILMDEPFGALDPITKQDLHREFLDLEGIIEKAIVMVTHDVSEAIYLGDTICLMDQGRIVQAGKPEELLFQPKNDFVSSFFDHHRYELELLVFKLADLAPFLSDKQTSDLQEISSNQTLKVTLDQVGEEAFHFKSEGACYEIDNLLTAYYQHRTAIINSRNGST